MSSWTIRFWFPSNLNDARYELENKTKQYLAVGLTRWFSSSQWRQNGSGCTKRTCSRWWSAFRLTRISTQRKWNKPSPSSFSLSFSLSFSPSTTNQNHSVQVSSTFAMAVWTMGWNRDFRRRIRQNANCEMSAMESSRHRVAIESQSSQSDGANPIANRLAARAASLHPAPSRRS